MYKTKQLGIYSQLKYENTLEKNSLRIMTFLTSCHSVLKQMSVSQACPHTVW